MYRDGIAGGPVKRVEPFQGLMIDSGVWRDAHDYHRRHQQLHALLLHGAGIVRGLEVEPAPKPGRSLLIQPGVALDPEGRLIVVPQPITYQVNATTGVVYLILAFRDIPADPLLSLEDGARRPSRMVEGYSVAEYDHLPDGPYVELARLRLGAGKEPLVAASDPGAPGANQIDLRFRAEAAIRPGLLAGLGCWRATPAAEEATATETDHAAGLGALARAMAGACWQIQWTEAQAGARDPLEADLLLLPLDGKLDLSEADQLRLRVFLDEGGVILAEPCSHHGKRADREAALEALPALLERRPQPVAYGHPLLTATHIFGAPPPGAAEGEVHEAGGLILSQADYACAWQGGTATKPLARETIRAAQEFGENLLAYALQRRRAWKATQ